MFNKFPNVADAAGLGGDHTLRTTTSDFQVFAFFCQDSQGR